MNNKIFILNRRFKFDQLATIVHEVSNENLLIYVKINTEGCNCMNYQLKTVTEMSINKFEKVKQFTEISMNKWEKVKQFITFAGEPFGFWFMA